MMRFSAKSFNNKSKTAQILPKAVGARARSPSGLSNKRRRREILSFLSREKCKSPVSPPTPARKHGMPHDLLHAHPFYDDRPLLDDARLPPPPIHTHTHTHTLTTPTSRGEMNSGEHVTNAETRYFPPGEEPEPRRSCNLIFTLCYSSAASPQQSSCNYMCTKFKVGVCAFFFPSPPLFLLLPPLPPPSSSSSLTPNNICSPSSSLARRSRIV